MIKRGLGRGLGALLPMAEETLESPAKADAASLRLPLTAIDPSPWQPRKHLKEEHLQELVASLRQQGLIQPVIVRRRGERYELIAGERRWRAAAALGWREIPAIVKDVTDAAAREMALVENLQREDLNPIEEASAYEELRRDLGLTHEQIAERIGKSRAHITNTLRLLALPDEVRRLVSAGTLSAGHARALLSLPDAVGQQRLAQRAMRQGLSVREVERLASRLAKGEDNKRGGRTQAPEARDLEERLRAYLGTRVAVKNRKGKGKVIIEYTSVDDLQRILERIGLPADRP